MQLEAQKRQEEAMKEYDMNMSNQKKRQIWEREAWKALAWVEECQRLNSRRSNDRVERREGDCTANETYRAREERDQEVMLRLGRDGGFGTEGGIQHEEREEVRISLSIARYMA